MEEGKKYPSTFNGLLALVGYLRGPDGCPWDQEQTPDSLRRYILEECYELLEAIDECDRNKMLDELGDVLFNIAFQIQLGIEEQSLTAEQVFGHVNEKLVRRHPHVFGDAVAIDSHEVEAKWHALKRAEQLDADTSIMSSVPKEMPALAYAQMIQERAALAGFDWEEVQDVVQKISEELHELGVATSEEEKEAELGDLLFTLVNLGRWLSIDAEDALRGAVARFRKRFSLMEKLSNQRRVSFENLTLSEKEALWQEAKSLED